MNIYTSYFAMADKIPKDYAQVAISRIVPDWFRGRYISELAPSTTMLREYRASGDALRYAKEYEKRVLDEMTPEQVARILLGLGEENVVLMCYERPEKFCHRHLVGTWLAGAGYLVTELEFTKEEKTRGRH